MRSGGERADYFSASDEGFNVCKHFALYKLQVFSMLRRNMRNLPWFLHSLRRARIAGLSLIIVEVIGEV